MKLRIAHFSDSHLGYEAFPALSSYGHNQRGEDIVRAFSNVAHDILSYDPDVVIHAGDIGERPKIGVNYMLVAQRRFAELTKRPDGRRRPVVIIAGNHDLPRSRKEACWLEILAQIPDVFVSCYQYDIFDFAGRGYGDEYEDLLIHTLPHDALKEVDFDLVVPVEGKRNVLTTHGVAAGSELFTRGLGREFAISSEVLTRSWEYVALGHFHKRGPVALGKKPDPRIWYSGSSENISFRDLRDNGTTRGYLRVELSENVVVTPVDLPIRRMYRLAVVEATGLTPGEIESALISRIEEGDLQGSVVGQLVEGVTRDVWSLVDVAKVRGRAESALHYEVSVHYVKSEIGEEHEREFGDLPGLVENEVAASVSAEMAPDVLALARTLLGSALHQGPSEAQNGEQPEASLDVEREEERVLEEIPFDDVTAQEVLRSDSLVEHSSLDSEVVDEALEPARVRVRRASVATKARASQSVAKKGEDVGAVSHHTAKKLTEKKAPRKRVAAKKASGDDTE